MWLLRYAVRVVYRPASRYPADPRAVFILALTVFSGITAASLNVAPESLDALLPKWAVIVWGVSLTAGSAITLVGMARQSVGGVVTEQIGSVIVGVCTVYYSVVALMVIGVDALQVVGIVLAWGLSCFARWGQLQALINSAYRQQVENQQDADQPKGD